LPPPLSPPSGPPVFFDWYAPLKNGINLDVATPNSGAWFTWQYEKSQMQAIAEAGFESVRIFMPFASKMEDKQKQIEDALDAGLSIVVCMWGEWGWSWNVEQGVSEISNGRRNRGEGWGALARAWKVYPQTGARYNTIDVPAAAPPSTHTEPTHPACAGLLQTIGFRGTQRAQSHWLPHDQHGQRQRDAAMQCGGAGNPQR